MSRSNHKHPSHLRSAYSGERYATARAALGRGTDLGFDFCGEGQRRFRDILAWRMFNVDPSVKTPEGLPHNLVPEISGYAPLTFSPRYSSLIIITPTAPNVTRRLVPWDGPTLRSDSPWTRPRRELETSREQRPITEVPGLRLISGRTHTFECQHLTTGGRFVVTRHRSLNRWHRADNEGEVDGTDGWGIEVPLTPIELTSIENRPEIPAGISALLRAILVRMEFISPTGQWAASWFWDPLGRWTGNDDPVTWGFQTYRQVTGHGSRWRLAWNGYPYATDLAAMLTDPIVGLADASAAQVGPEAYDIAFLGAVLELRPIGHDNWLEQTGSATRRP